MIVVILKLDEQVLSTEIIITHCQTKISLQNLLFLQGVGQRGGNNNTASLTTVYTHINPCEKEHSSKLTKNPLYFHH